MALNDNWTPVLNGHIYCSPACGFHCTKEAFDTATARAAELASKLGPKFKPRVWENMGWHYTAVCEMHARIEVHPAYGLRGVYWASITTPNAPQFQGEDTCPKVALVQALAAAHRFIDSMKLMQRELYEISDSIPRR